MSSEAEKKARLASALRANLTRRKAQGRARAAQEAPDTPSDAAGPDTVDAPGVAPRGDGRIVPKDGAS